MRNFFSAVKRVSNFTVSNSYSRYPAGIKSLEDYDALARMNIYPLNLLSEEGKAEFRSRIKFGMFNNEKVVNGVGSYALKELGYNKYVDLLKLITGKNPVIDGKQPISDPNYRVDNGTWQSGYEPRPEHDHCCKVSGGSVCWVPKGGNQCPDINFSHYHNNF